MVKKIMHDPLFLAQKSVDATEADVIQGRMRKYYFITEKGYKKLLDLKAVYQSESKVLERWFGEKVTKVVCSGFFFFLKKTSCN